MTYKEQYKKLRKNIQKQIKYYKDKGFLVENEIPDIPKRVTKASVKKLEKYKSSFKKLNFIDVETGEKGKLEKLKRERKKEYKKAEEDFWTGNAKETEDSNGGQESSYDYINFSDSVIAEYLRQISRFPDKVASIVLTKLDEAIKKSGKDVVAYRLQYSNISLSEYLNNVGLFGDSIQAILEYCDAMFGDLPGMDKQSRLQISDILDSESYNE